VHECNHPVYSRCTLYKIENRGLAVIQQYYNAKFKTTWWCEIDARLVDDLYSHPGFYAYFDSKAKEPDSNDIYPTVTLRQIMYGLKMKPLKRLPWETVFDKSPI